MSNYSLLTASATKNTSKKTASPLSTILASLGLIGPESSSSLELVNSYTRYVQNVCRASCTQLQNNTSLILLPGSSTGPISFSQSCQVENVDCALKTLVQLATQDMLSAITSSAQAPSINVYGSTLDSLLTSESLEVGISNSLTQLIVNTCNFDTNQVMNGNYVYLGQDATASAITFAQTSDISNVVCATDVISKGVQFARESSSASESDGSKVYRRLLYILGFVIVLCVIMLGVYFTFRNTSPIVSLSEWYYAQCANLGPAKIN